MVSVFVGVNVVCFYRLYKQRYIVDVMERGEKATAEIYACSYAHRTHAICWYKYVDENGIEYTGIWGPVYDSMEEAEQNLGKKIEIYIDGKGESTPVETVPSFGLTYTYIIISLLFTCADTVGIVIVSVKIHKERKQKKTYTNS